jgi:hypothetical protein
VTGERFRVLGLAQARAGWFREVSRWSTSAAIPVDFIKCVSLDELTARLQGGRVFSAVLIDAGVSGLDRDLVDRAREAGAASLVVDDGHTRRNWAGLGIGAVLPASFDRALLLTTLLETSRPIRGAEATAGRVEPLVTAGWRGRLVAVTGPAGGGSSTVAMAAAQGLGRSGPACGAVGDADEVGRQVLLADLALHADLALLHDAGDIVPGLQELVEAHGGGLPSTDEVRSLTFFSQERGYHLLLGLRRHRDWTVLRPRAVQAGLDGLLRTFETVVADVDSDVEGDEEVGSVDVEERNLLARSTLSRADLVLVTAAATIGGLRRLVLTLDELVRFGIGPDRLQPVLSRAPRRPRARAELTAAVAELGRAVASDLGALASPLFVAERAGLDQLHRSGSQLPRSLVEPVTAAVSARLAGRPVLPAGIQAFEPTPVVPGSLGAWSDDEEVAG